MSLFNSSDLEDNLQNELLHFHQYVKMELKCVPKNELKSSKVINTMKEILVTFRLYVTLPRSLCEGERSFSKLSIIKNEKRTTMLQE